MKHLKNIFYASLLLIGILASCTSDDFSTNIAHTDYVSLNLSTGNATPASRETEPGVDDLNENLIQTADVFVFNHSTNARVHYQRLEDLQLPGKGEISLSLSKSQVSTGTYDVYVIANYTGESLADVQSVDGLKTKSITTEFKFVTGAIEDSFLMDGKLEDVSLAGETSNTVNLYRAAAKIEVNIQTGEDADGNVYQLLGGLQKRIINYATHTKLLPDGNEVSDKELKNTDYIKFQSNQARFYTYANSWSFDPESSQVDLNDETYILLNLPVRVTPADGEPTEHNPNYYRVSLNRNSGAQSLERNHSYRINVTLKALGSNEELKPVELTGSVEVQQWQETTINVGTDDAKFLEVNEEYIYLANIDANESTDNSLMFYSSSVITNIQVSGVKYTDKYGVVRSFTKNDTDYPDGKTYYPTVEWKHDETTGAVTIHSKDLINVPKTFTLTITNADGLTKKVYVEQYPLEYITSTQGWYSYRADFGSSWIDKGTGKTSTGNEDDGNFGSKVVRQINADGTSLAYKYRWDRGDNGYPSYNLDNWSRSGKPYFNSRQNSGRTNARMYHVRITAASSEYKLGYPEMDGEYTANSDENAKIVSPSFMIASQLGSTDATESFDAAKKQCANYVEVTNVTFNGEDPDDSKQKTYDDWRLPTPAELEIIATFQKVQNSAIDEVLVSNAYWSSNGEYSVRTDGDEGTRIRCVRDVKPEETGN